MSWTGQETHSFQVSDPANLKELQWMGFVDANVRHRMGCRLHFYLRVVTIVSVISRLFTLQDLNFWVGSKLVLAICVNR